ncbi:hypothetical protein [Sulfurimonas sp. NWX79]|uniref:hypothetical protein n=1 Tax=Campylobacterales TaxID=213849 RepID=UPI003204E84C
MNYKTYPTDYIQELNTSRGAKGRKKSRAFMEYWNDMEFGEHNSYGFYAKSWEVSKSTAHVWIDEFMNEIELFLSHWDIRNKQHYKHAKNQSERLPNKTNGYKHQNIGVFKEAQERQPNEALNLNNNNNTHWAFDKDFNDLYFIYGVNTKYKGKKEEAFEEFKQIDIDINLLKLASMKYLHDPDTEGKRYNLTNFLKNQTYLSYMPKVLKVKINNKWIIGNYDDKNMMFISDDKSFIGSLSANRLIELYQNKELEFIDPTQRRVL